MTPTRRAVLLAQGSYYVTTGVAPFLSRQAFEALTGPKREWWLVQTVGGLVTVVGGAVLYGAGRRRHNPDLVGVAAGTAAVLAAIDVIYVTKRRISPRYLVDAAAQLALLAGLLLTRRRATWAAPCAGEARLAYRGAIRRAAPWRRRAMRLRRAR